MWITTRKYVARMLHVCYSSTRGQLSPLPNTMKINIIISNEHGELLDKQFVMSLDEMRNIDMNLLINEAEKNGEEDGLLGLYDSKEEAELAVEDVYDGSSKIDLINSDETFN